ncbi:unnamed protein product [Tetraodon nigroviridis]|uniref:(spotted green pufferfish) hypothetical protein n=1 Tax=Tetraodon nigroviridis TaxID=99883 RepID=Q4RYP1_TETNG|nr:unnamed protein product [Tetraodon nigroviridis]
MALPGSRARMWALFLCLNWIFTDGAAAGPQFMVAIPAVMEAGAESRLCISLLQPNETLAVTAKLVFEDKATVIFERSSDKEFHQCAVFQAPEVETPEVHALLVTVRGDQFHSVESRKVMFKSYKPETFVQTDKPIYLPGQTVHFRVVTLDSMFRPANGLFHTIKILDSHQNRIGQWLNATTDGDILQLSFPLSAEAREGYYSISVWMEQSQVTRRFKVEKYVLPKFEVTIEMADQVSVGQEEIDVDVCAKYTYGQPVPATVTVEMCRKLRSSSDTLIQVPCFEEEKKTSAAAPNSPPACTLFSKQKRVELSFIIGKLFFVDTPNSYNEGSMLEGKIKVVHYNDTPIADKQIQLLNDKSWQGHVLQNLTTDADGIATFSLNTTLFNGEEIQLRALVPEPEPYAQKPKFESAHHRASLYQPPSPHSKSVSSLTVSNTETPLLCEGDETLSIDYAFVGETAGTVNLMYLIVSRGKIVTQGVQTVQILTDPTTEGSISFTLKMSPEFSPALQVVAYTILPSEHVIAHKADLAVTKCFLNKVSVEFSPTSAVPGDDTTLKVKALPDSLCGVSAIDQSVLVKEPGNTLTPEQIFNMLPVRKVSSIPYEVEDAVPCLRVRQKRYIGRRRRPDDVNDAYSVFEGIGLKVATNLLFRMPSCVNFRGLEFHRGFVLYRESVPYIMAMKQKGTGAAPGGGVIETIRTFFPETWVWKLVKVGESGETDVALTVPDTITTWETEAFCVSPQGFGLAPRKEITVFQPFFLELSLPYSIVRGEQFELKATVFNYQTSCMMVSVKTAKSEDYTLTPLSANEYTSCLCGNERKTLSWTMLPSVIGVVSVTVTAEAVASHASCDNEIVSVPERGRTDTVTRSLIVKAEGTEMTKIHNWLLCPKEEPLKEEVELDLPANVIDGSARALVSVLGDILGRALKNLDGLLRMPYGCGEQNMALLAPNIYILQYLKSTGQLTDTILKKATHFLTSGYQRQLNYKHSNGAFSTFGTGSGNTWLTAFVVRSFAKAKTFVYIDEAKMLGLQKLAAAEAEPRRLFPAVWKTLQQQDEGRRFRRSDAQRLHHGRLPGDGHVAHRPGDPQEHAVPQRLRQQPEQHLHHGSAGLRLLPGWRHEDAGFPPAAPGHGGLRASLLYWSQSAEDQSSSLSVEISSYVLLAKLSSSPTAEDLGYASRIVRWLTGQQNYYGGFSSTQDTVVALQALALYSTLVFSPAGSSTVTVQAPSGQLVFDVNQDNKLLYQEKTLQDLKGTISLEAAGSMCASIQISLHYNIPTPTDTNIFSISVKPECSSEKNRVTLQLMSQYSGKDITTNMVILDVKMLSGFVPDPESVNSAVRCSWIGLKRRRREFSSTSESC